MTPTLSLITGARNRPEAFRQLLESIERHTPMPWELVVSDASDTPLQGLLPPNVVVIPERPRKGCTVGYNNAFRRAAGEWVLWLNDDVTVEPGYAETAIKFMERNPDIGLGALYYAEANQIYHVNTCCYGMLYANFGILSRELGNRVGWFDEDLAMYGNDNSLTYRVLLAGKGIASIPGARLFHHSVNDQERQDNNNMPFRIAQAELLKAKYGPHLSEMRAVYERPRMVTA